jgi:hypothetical protein
MTEPAKRGRPPRDGKAGAARQVNVRVSDEEYEAIESAADDCDVSVSEWIRLVARGAAGMPALEVHLERAHEAHRVAIGITPNVLRAAWEDAEREKKAKRRGKKP